MKVNGLQSRFWWYDNWMRNFRFRRVPANTDPSDHPMYRNKYKWTAVCLIESARSIQLGKPPSVIPLMFSSKFQTIAACHIDMALQRLTHTWMGYRSNVVAGIFVFPPDTARHSYRRFTPYQIRDHPSDSVPDLLHFFRTTADQARARNSPTFVLGDVKPFWSILKRQATLSIPPCPFEWSLPILGSWHVGQYLVKRCWKSAFTRGVIKLLWSTFHTRACPETYVVPLSTERWTFI